MGQFHGWCGKLFEFLGIDLEWYRLWRCGGNPTGKQFLECVHWLAYVTLSKGFGSEIVLRLEKIEINEMRKKSEFRRFFRSVSRRLQSHVFLRVYVPRNRLYCCQHSPIGSPPSQQMAQLSSSIDIEAELEYNRRRVIALIDLDCFYAQVISNTPWEHSNPIPPSKHR